jgi:hypothetical protein
MTLISHEFFWLRNNVLSQSHGAEFGFNLGHP